MNDHDMARSAVSGYRPGPSTIREINGLLLVTSEPIRLHTAMVRRTAGMDYVVRMISLPFDPIVGRYGTLDAARAGAGRAVSARTVVDMKQVFTGVQRSAMRQQKCPYRHRNRLCLAAAAGWSVWCADHPKGRSADVDG